MSLVTFVESTLDKLLTPMLPTGGTTNPMNAKEAYDAIYWTKMTNMYPPGNFLMKNIFSRVG